MFINTLYERFKNGTVNFTLRFAVMMVLIFACFGYVIYRLHEIQVTRHDELSYKARRCYLASVINRAPRGGIRDSRGTIFAGDEPYFTLVVDPCNFPVVEKRCDHTARGDAQMCPICPRNQRTILQAAEFMSEHLGIARAELKSKFNARIRYKRAEDGSTQVVPNRYVRVTKHIDYEEGKKLNEEMKNYILNLQKSMNNSSDRMACDFSKAFTFEVNYTRSYPRNEMLSTLIGFANVAADTVLGISDAVTGVAGLEKCCTDILSPKHGRYTYERARSGGTIGNESSVNQYIPPEPGGTLYLTIQEPIQTIIEEEANILVEKHAPKKVYIIVIDPHTGDILAAVQRPAFNPNDRNSFNASNISNFLCEGVYEPGSIFKPITISRAVDEQLVTEHTPINCERRVWYYAGKPLRDTHDNGIIPLAEVISHSSNIGTIKVALMLGAEKIYENLRAFGFGEKSTLPLRPQSRGLLPRLQKWSKLSAARIPIGQGIAVTPLQMARAFSVFANGGYLPELRLIDRIVYTYEADAREGKGVSERVVEGPRVEPKPMFTHPKETSQQMVDMLKLVCAKGTGVKAQIPGYYVAGKTGTAQKAGRGGYAAGKYVASFIGFAPADNPRFLMLVTLDEPTKNGYYGGSVCGPAFSRAGERILKYMGVMPDYEVYGDDDPNPRRKGQHKKLEELRKRFAEAYELPDIPLRDPVDVRELSGEESLFNDCIWYTPETPDEIPTTQTQIPLFDESDLQFMRESREALRAIENNAQNER